MIVKPLKHKAGSSSLSGSFRHCDKDIREIAKHGNEHIDVRKTSENDQIIRDYEETLKRFQERILTIDELGENRNHRKDRVEAVEMCVPIPSGVNEPEEYFRDICGIFSEKYGQENFINGYLHKDEVHSYLDHGETRESLRHMHIFFVPEKDGSLNAKELTGRWELIDLNNRIDKISRDKYQVAFKGYDGQINHESVEQLKARSQTEVLDLMKAIQENRTAYPYEEKDDSVIMHKSDFELMRDQAAVAKVYAKKYNDAFRESESGKLTEDLNAAVEYEKKLIEEAEEKNKKAEEKLKEAERIRSESEAKSQELSERIIKIKKEITHEIEKICQDESNPESTRHALARSQIIIEKMLDDHMNEYHVKEKEKER